MKYFLLLSMSLLLSSCTTTKRVKLSWIASPTLTVIGYKVYYGPRPGFYNGSQTYGLNTEETIQMKPGKWYFVCTAFSALAESQYSNEVNFEVKK